MENKIELIRRPKPVFYLDKLNNTQTDDKLK
jgi:hypothetical protein